MTQDWLRFRINEVRKEIESLEFSTTSMKQSLDEKMTKLQHNKEVLAFLMQHYEGELD